MSRTARDGGAHVVATATPRIDAASIAVFPIRDTPARTLRSRRISKHTPRWRKGWNSTTARHVAALLACSAVTESALVNSVTLQTHKWQTFLLRLPQNQVFASNSKKKNGLVLESRMRKTNFGLHAAEMQRLPGYSRRLGRQSLASFNGARGNSPIELLRRGCKRTDALLFHRSWGCTMSSTSRRPSGTSAASRDSARK